MTQMRAETILRLPGKPKKYHYKKATDTSTGNATQSTVHIQGDREKMEDAGDKFPCPYLKFLNDAQITATMQNTAAKLNQLCVEAKVEGGACLGFTLNWLDDKTNQVVVYTCNVGDVSSFFITASSESKDAKEQKIHVERLNQGTHSAEEGLRNPLLAELKAAKGASGVARIPPNGKMMYRWINGNVAEAAINKKIFAVQATQKNYILVACDGLTEALIWLAKPKTFKPEDLTADKNPVIKYEDLTLPLFDLIQLIRAAETVKQALELKFQQWQEMGKKLCNPNDKTVNPQEFKQLEAELIQANALDPDKKPMEFFVKLIFERALKQAADKEENLAWHITMWAYLLSTDNISASVIQPRTIPWCVPVIDGHSASKEVTKVTNICHENLAKSLLNSALDETLKAADKNSLVYQIVRMVLEYYHPYDDFKDVCIQALAQNTLQPILADVVPALLEDWEELKEENQKYLDLKATPAEQNDILRAKLLKNPELLPQEQLLFKLLHTMAMNYLHPDLNDFCSYFHRYVSNRLQLDQKSILDIKPDKFADLFAGKEAKESFLQETVNANRLTNITEHPSFHFKNARKIIFIIDALALRAHEEMFNALDNDLIHNSDWKDFWEHQNKLHPGKELEIAALQERALYSYREKVIMLLERNLEAQLHIKVTLDLHKDNAVRLQKKLEQLVLMPGLKEKKK